jgi:hypothetical protein
MRACGPNVDVIHRPGAPPATTSTEPTRPGRLQRGLGQHPVQKRGLLALMLFTDVGRHGAPT